LKKLFRYLSEKLNNYFTVEGKIKDRGYLCDFDRICHEIILCDVLLIEGTSRVSKIIKQITCSPWTHSALYIGRLHSISDPELRATIKRHFNVSPDKQLIIESLMGQGTVIQEIDKYKNHHIRICRPAGLSHADAQTVIGYAVRRLSTHYNVRHFFDLGRFLLKSHLLPRRWKSTLFQEEKRNQITQDICSALIASAFDAIDFPILPVIRQKPDHDFEMLPRNPKLYTPSDFDYSPYFSIIKYPMFPLYGKTTYHHFPWQEGLESQDEGIITPRRINKDNNEPKS
jgi:hypothetical protein